MLAYYIRDTSNSMAPAKREVLVSFRLTEVEAAWLKELAELDGLYQSDVLRLLIRREYQARSGGKSKR